MPLWPPTQRRQARQEANTFRAFRYEDMPQRPLRSQPHRVSLASESQYSQMSNPSPRRYNTIASSAPDLRSSDPWAASSGGRAPSARTQMMSQQAWYRPWQSAEAVMHGRGRGNLMDRFNQRVGSKGCHSDNAVSGRQYRGAW